LAFIRERDGSLPPDLEVWEVASKKMVVSAKDSFYMSLAFHPQLPLIIAGQRTGELVVWELDQGKQIAHFGLPCSPVVLRFSPDGQYFAAACESEPGHAVSVHRIGDGARIWSATLTNMLADLSWHPGGRWLAATDRGGFVHLLDSRNGELRTLGRHKAEA